MNTFPESRVAYSNSLTVNLTCSSTRPSALYSKKIIQTNLNHPQEKMVDMNKSSKLKMEVS